MVRAAANYVLIWMTFLSTFSTLGVPLLSREGKQRVMRAESGRGPVEAPRGLW